MDGNKKKGIAIQIFVYLMAIAVAIGVGYYFRESHVLLHVLYADVAGTLVIFLFSRIFHNSSLYDPYWSVAPAVIVAYYLYTSQYEDSNRLRNILTFILVQWWSWRLTFNFLRGWQGIHQQDWRYDDLQQQSGKLFPFVELFGIQLFPTFMVFAGCLPLYWIYFYGGDLGIWDAIACVITFGAIFIEWLADRQLFQFIRKKKEKGSTLTSGLWAYSRHPNYFGEMMFWWGLFLFGLAACPQQWYYFVAGGIIITCLFFFISVPLIDKRMLRRRNNYQEVMDNISGIVPWLPKKRF